MQQFPWRSWFSKLDNVNAFAFAQECKTEIVNLKLSSFQTSWIWTKVSKKNLLFKPIHQKNLSWLQLLTADAHCEVNCPERESCVIIQSLMFTCTMPPHTYCVQLWLSDKDWHSICSHGFVCMKLNPYSSCFIVTYFSLIIKTIYLINYHSKYMHKPRHQSNPI